MKTTCVSLVCQCLLNIVQMCRHIKVIYYNHHSNRCKEVHYRNSHVAAECQLQYTVEIRVQLHLLGQVECLD